MKSRKKPVTPNSQIKSALHRLWLRSRERAAAVKRDGNTCQSCGKKGSKAKGREVKTEVHHLDGVEWQNIIAYIRRHLLCDPSRLEILCDHCHDIEHEIKECNHEN
jgi:5-methylcytosine-specific restriction endonuclease McrA